MNPPAKRNDDDRKDARRAYLEEGVKGSKEADRRADEAEKNQKGGKGK